MKKNLKKTIDKVLNKTFTDKNGNEIEGAEVLAKWLFKEAVKGNVEAFETIRNTCGQGATQKIIFSQEGVVINKGE